MTEQATGDIVPILAPVMDALEALADTTERLTGTGMALAHSPAMRELSEEGAIANGYFEEPVHAAHSNANILRFAATDSVRQFARLFRSQPVPVYAHLAVARAGLESAALSYWAGARNIGSIARVQRYQAIRLRNCIEMKRSPIPEFKRQATRNRAQIRKQCAKRSWNLIANSSRIEVGDQRFPGSGALIKALLARGSDEPGLQGLGATAWWQWSGVSHAVNYALIESVDSNNPTPSLLGPNTVPIFTSSRSVSFQALILGRGYQTLIEEHRQVFGWTNPTWTDANARFIGEARRILSARGPQ